MAYEYFYPGTPYSLSPNYDSVEKGGLFTGYRMGAGELGMATDPRTALQIQEMSSKLNVGVKAMEISTVTPDVFDSIPKQHLQEMNRLSKLTGVKTTMHAPIVEASGYTKEGWNELYRQATENQMKSFIERAHDLEPHGGMPVTFHATAALPSTQETVKENGVEKIKSVLIVDPRTGDIKQLKEKERHFPGQKSEFNVVEEIKRINDDSWAESTGQIAYAALRGEEHLNIFERSPSLKDEDVEAHNKNYFKAYAFSRTNPEEYEKFGEEEKKYSEKLFKTTDSAYLMLRDAYRGLRELYNVAYTTTADSKEERAKLEAYAKKIEPLVNAGIENDKEKLKEFAGVIQDGVKLLGTIKPPQIYQKLDSFLIGKSAETFANTAFSSFKKFKDNSPIITIENPPYGGGLSRASELKSLIEASREKLAKNLIEKEGIEKEQAKKISEKMIGATWDVGHINMIRKYGYDADDVVKEAKTIAPFVKHVHLSDNFGMEHTELPMGMGNVPTDKIMAELKKAGVDAKKIIEAGNWWQHMKTSPFSQTLAGFGSPMYSGNGGPYWNQAYATYGNYFATPMSYFPEQHFSLYGTGFSGLPNELGGQIPGKQSRATGTPVD